MIHRIYSSDKGFKEIKFYEGLNLIVADKKPNSGVKDSRNGVGKTVLIYLIQFCLGAKLDKSKIPYEDIKEWSFSIDLDLGGSIVTATRFIGNDKIVYIKGINNNLIINPEYHIEDDTYIYSLEEWKLVLGAALFNLDNESDINYGPSFRTLMSYFGRNEEGYDSPFKSYHSQLKWSIQLATAFLIGLEYRVANTAKMIAEKKSVVRTLKKSLKLKISADRGELETLEIRLQSEVNSMMSALETYQVYDQYKEIQVKADRLTTEIRKNNNRITYLTQKLTNYREATNTGVAPTNIKVEELFNEVGLVFPDNLKASLDEANRFYRKVVENRKAFLSEEISEISNEIIGLQDLLHEQSDIKASLMKILETHGALDDYTKLQQVLIENQIQLEIVKNELNRIKGMAQTLKEIKRESLELEHRIQRDYDDRKPFWERVVKLFNDNTKALYHEAGDLIINPDKNGYKFDVRIHRSGSEGVNKMKIFCYDLALVEIWSKNKGIDFLIHDSTLYDAVDSRQIANALVTAHVKGKSTPFQYICMFNTDNLPSDDLPVDFELNDFVRLRLHDKGPDGCLLGFRYN